MPAANAALYAARKAREHDATRMNDEHFDGDYPRDLAGYGAHPPHPRWPGGARIAVQFVLNYEEGAENSVLHGDAASETFLSEIIGAAAFADRHLSMESLYEYGARAGVWRVLRLFDERNMPLTIFGVAMALARNPAVVDACVAAGHEIASHGLRWISYQDVDEDVEREHIARAVETITRLTGAPPAGWYTGRDSPRTRRLVVEHGGFVYDADSYADDLPYWTDVDDAATARTAASRRAVRARHERHALRHRAGLQQRRPVLRLSARRVRHAVRGRRPARAETRRRCCRSACMRACRPPGTHRRARAFPRSRAAAR